MTDKMTFTNPPREFGVMPFWFWNDDLNDCEIRRQIADFDAHGAGGFIIHPRIGLPRKLLWMSPELLHFYDVAIDEAKRRGMYVVLYDEGMYPSGSSHGQVVAENPAFATRALGRIELSGEEKPELPNGWNLLTVLKRRNGQRVAVVDRPAESRIRGLHYVEPGDLPSPDAGPQRGGDPPQDEPPAADLLNPAAVDCFIRLVYERFAEHYGKEFGKTVFAMFTDEPDVLGKFRPPDLRPGTTGIMDHVNKLLGYDFTPHLLSLWYDEEPDALKQRHAYEWAINRRMQETYYRRLFDWCGRNNLPLTGHPAWSDEIGIQRYFHFPGQDTVWRMVLPGPTATEGVHATQAKCTSSAMIHLGRRRNANECCGAYGHELTYEQMLWLANWLLVRGVNLLFPHAFYYSIRGPRREERPPDVGPNSPWWNRYRAYADLCRRLCWLNTDSRHVCDVAILGESNHLPWEAAKILQEQQIDFNYLEMQHLWEDARVDAEGVRLSGMHYRVVIVDDLLILPGEALKPLKLLAENGRLLSWKETLASRETGCAVLSDAARLKGAVGRLAVTDVTCDPPVPDLRIRHVIKDDRHWYLLFNEGERPLSTRLDCSIGGEKILIDPLDASYRRWQDTEELHLKPFQMRVMTADLGTYGKS